MGVKIMKGIDVNFCTKVHDTQKQIGAYVDEKYRNMGQWLDSHPTVYKIAVIAMHLMRTLSMAALMAAMPFRPFINFSLSLIASEAYRIVIERHCAFKFARLSCLGGEALLFPRYAVPVLVNILARETFPISSLALLGAFSLGIAPFALYVGTIVYVSIKDVNEKLEAQGISKCCSPSS